MLSIDHTLIGSVVCVRPSMDKFDAPNSLSIEVAEVVTTPKRVYLNQDLISVLETLGVQPSVFLALQQQAVAATKAAEDSFFAAAKMLESHSLGGTFRVPAILTHLHKLGLGFASYPDDLFLQTATQSGIYHGLRDLKQSARIPVKGNYTLFGIADVHSFLKEGQIFGTSSSLHKPS
jgi:RNA-dependent RNA polymerase